MQNERPLVVVNPRSGGGKAGRTFSDVQAVLERKIGAVDVALTANPAHAIELAREAALGGAPLVIAVGGDGTLHEVANGVLDAGGKAAVGYIGQGTGGDFRRTLGLEHRLDAYVDAIASGRERRVDAGKLRYRATDGQTRTRWFVNILSAGMGGLVDRYVSETSKALGGTAAYFFASTRALLSCQRGRLRCDVSLEGERHERRVETFMIAICNGRYFGSGMHVAPMAEVDDGRFEVVSMDAPSKLAFATFSRRIYEGKHLSAPGVQHFACDRISIEIENERARPVFLLDVDGEPLGGLPLEVELVPKALTLRV
ncbi:MAG TPA: diacylglycerol kinase family protein [Polyangiaceae bacterium]|jgi:YegS/Rv2252/BmrU family lipid kinase